MEDLLIHWREIEFPYKNILYYIVNSTDWYWYFWSDELKLNMKVCLFEEREKLINFLKEHKINWKTVEEIFNEEKFHEDVLWIY